MNQQFKIVNEDCLEAMKRMEDGTVDTIVTDPPYGLSFMGAKWDNMVAYQERMTPIFEEALRVAKPGAHMLCFGGTRTFHRLACAIEDAGWNIKDCIMWVYGSGFPHGMNVSKAIDKELGAKRNVIGEHPNPAGNKGGGNSLNLSVAGMPEKAYITEPASDQAKQWDGWNTQLKPAWEPIIVARKTLDGTVAHNVMTYGTGAINIDACRVPTSDKLGGGMRGGGSEAWDRPWMHDEQAQAEFVERKKSSVAKSENMGRFPANLVHDGSQEVLELFPNDSGRFFYCAKASKKDRGEGNNHPTIKPNALMRYLVRLVCRKGGLVLDPFMGSGSTGVACMDEGMSFVGIELDEHYCDIARSRIGNASQK